MGELVALGCLAWLLAMAGLGGASLAFAVSAPGQAWWVLGLVVAALLAGPHLVQRRLRRSGRTERLAAGWWAGDPGPVEVAFLCGGPDRVVDLVLTDLVAEGRVALDEEGRLGLTGPGGDETGPPAGDFRRQILDRLSYTDADVATLRFATRSVAAMPALWRSGVHRGLLLPAWRREYTHWFVAGAIAVVGYGVSVALSRAEPGNDLPFGVAVAAIALGVVALWRPRFLVGYEFDPRTAAGLRAAELAFLANRPDDRRHRTALHGIRSAGDLGSRAPDRLRVPASHWHVPWYARRVHEGSAPWWRDVAQATTDYAEPLRDPGTGHGSAAA